MEPEKPKHEFSKRALEFHKAVNEQCAPRIERVSAPILGIQDDKFVHDRTGVLYRIANEHFVLTAAHDLQKIVENNIPLYLSANVKGKDPIPLAQARFISTEAHDRDVGVIWLPPDMAQEVAKSRQFLPHFQINLDPIKERTPYLMFGYPMKWSGHVVAEDHVVSMGMGFQTFLHEGQRHPTALFRPDVHVVMNFTREAIQALDGKDELLPTPHGISGCGIWQVGDRTSDGLRARTGDMVTLVGIEHTWFPDFGYVQGTRIGYALALITEYYPNTKGPMSLVYPPK